MSGYRFMRMLLMFDLPTETEKDRKAYRKFRKFLISEGFIMHQYSVYSKLLLNSTACNLMEARLQENIPDKGDITLLTVTEKQYAKMVYLSGSKTSKLANTDKRVIVLGENSDEY